MKYENNAKDLKLALEAFNVKHDFKPGDIVQWKEGLRNRFGKGPFIVAEFLSEPVFDTHKNAGSPYFREPLDIVLARIDKNEGFLLFHCDSRRFEPVDEEDYEDE